MKGLSKILTRVNLKWSQVVLLAAKVFLIAGSSVLLVSAYRPVWAQSLLGQETEIIRLTNDLRQKQGLPVLVENKELAASALAKATDMAVNGYFGHADKNGNRMAYWMTAAGYNYLRAGENLAKEFIDPTTVMEAWVNSPTHYANLINSNYQEIGVGITQGYIDGRLTAFIVQHFGEPMPNINLIPINIAKLTKNVMGDSMSLTTPNNQILVVLPSRQLNSHNESAITNTSPEGLLWVAYQDTKNILRQPLLPVSVAAAGVTDIGLPPKGYQAAQVLFIVLSFLGVWGWLSMLMWPIYTWLNKLRNRHPT